MYRWYDPGLQAEILYKFAVLKCINKNKNKSFDFMGPQNEACLKFIFQYVYFGVAIFHYNVCL